MKTIQAFALSIFTILAYLGFPLIGWGVGDIAGFLDNSARLALAILIGVFAILAFYQAMAIPAGGAVQKGDANKRHKKESALGHLGTAVFLVGGLILMGYSDRHSWLVFPDLPILRYSGLLLLAAGGLLAFWSAMTLGRQYSTEITIQKDHQLITSGPFRLIRHPRYLGLIFMALGYALLFRSLVGMAMTLLLIPALIWRITGEEKMMADEFGAEWQAYLKKTWRLVPFIF
jgi:protein-S-isoprenylcysteine O-methyltransferase Ste14